MRKKIVITSEELKEISRQIKTLYKKIKWLENKYWNWQHYFEIKKKRFDFRYNSRKELAKGIGHIRRLLENLSIQ